MVSETMGAVPIERFMAGHSRSLSIKEKIGEESKKNTSANPISEKKKRKTKQSCLLKDSQLDFRLLKIIKIYLQFTVTRTSKQKGI